MNTHAKHIENKHLNLDRARICYSIHLTGRLRNQRGYPRELGIEINQVPFSEERPIFLNSSSSGPAGYSFSGNGVHGAPKGAGPDEADWPAPTGAVPRSVPAGGSGCDKLMVLEREMEESSIMQLFTQPAVAL